MKMLYMAVSGSSDPTRASIPLHLAVNGSVEIDHDTSIVLGGEAAEMVRAVVRDGLEGLGVPPVRDLFAKARQHEVPIFV